MFEKWDVKFKSFPYLTRLTIGVAGLIIVAIIDYFTGPVLSAAFFYMVPVIYFGWYVGRFHGVLVAMISAVIWLGSDLMSGFEGVHPGIPYWNALVRLAVFLIVAVILVRLQEELRLQRETNEKLEKANAEITRLAAIKSDFISLVSHELRTPLTVIKESVNIVHDGSAGPVNAEQKDFLETVDRNARRLARLINDVLDFQKLESGRMDYKMTRGDINEVLEEVGRGFRVVAEKKGLGFELQKADRLPEVTFDHDKITQVLTNLLNNAVKFSKQGVISLRSEPCEGGVRISVTDQGVGIESLDFPKLFQSFSQVGLASQRLPGGTGLGLVISQKIIMDHGSLVNVVSEPGKGSTFSFVLKT